jgi:glycosyltransferase involved in cell wall biosynthesis
MMEAEATLPETVPNISVVIPTFNRSADLIDTIRSILNQDFQRIEVIIVDNGPSTDDTYKKIKLILDDPRVRYFRTHLQGVTFGRNLGNSLAKGTLIIQMDDDVTLIDPKTLGIVNSLFKNSSLDILGVMELKNEEDFEIFMLKEGVSGNWICVDNVLADTGQIDFLYNISTGYENFLRMPKGIYRIDSFRSCFLAYKSSVLSKIGNWDLNYISVGSKMGIREETDLLIRAKRKGLNIYYTNLTGIWHRAGKRDSSLTRRQGGLGRVFYCASAHSYMVVKDMIEQGRLWNMVKWLPFQLFWGAAKNPGMITALRQGGPLACLMTFLGFWYGLMFGMFQERKLTLDVTEVIY